KERRKKASGNWSHLEEEAGVSASCPADHVLTIEGRENSQCGGLTQVVQDSSLREPGSQIPQHPSVLQLGKKSELVQSFIHTP
ncbi:hypothetical protein P7K49_039788, partial [Saguinus oedipus]